jgi:hypothetical protein
MLDENAVPNRAPAAGVGKGKTIEQTYTKKTQLEHILLRPDTYSKFDPPLRSQCFVQRFPA